MPTREQWIASRVATRYQQRGDPVTLRRISMVSGPVGFVNPPLWSADLQVVTGIIDGGQTFFGMSASSLNGRLVVGDQFMVNAVTWQVGPMPTDIQTDLYGAPLADPDGTPVRGTPIIYNVDSVAQENRLAVIPVSHVGLPPPPAPGNFLGVTPSFTFGVDEPIYVASMSAYAMTAMGWTEVNDIGLVVAGTRSDGTTILRPAVDDQVIIRGIARNIMTVNENSRKDSTFLYNLRLR